MEHAPVCAQIFADCPGNRDAVYNAPMDFRDFFLKQKQAIRARTRQAAALVRVEHMDWCPAAGALTIGEMLRHLWMSEEGVRRVALDANFAYYEKRIPEGLRAILGAHDSLESELAAMERVHNETLGLVAAFPADRLEEERVLEKFGFRRKVYVILNGINEHEIHHRAQLMTYLRMLGTPVPEALAGTGGRR